MTAIASHVLRASTILLCAAASAAPVTRAQLESMAKDHVDPHVMQAIVARDCVDFDVDAGNAAELSRTIPADVLRAAIACRNGVAAVPATASSTVSPAPAAAAAAVAPTAPAPAPAVSAATVAAPAPAVAPAAPTGAAELRFRATFIGESGALACSCLLDGVEAATLTKAAEGSFGEAVPRAAIVRESAFLPVSPGRHTILFRCDPHGQEVTATVDVPAGQRRTVPVGETTLRHWKLRRVENK